MEIGNAACQSAGPRHLTIPRSTVLKREVVAIERSSCNCLSCSAYATPIRLNPYTLSTAASAISARIICTVLMAAIEGSN